MARLLPSLRNTAAAEEAAPRVIGLDSDDVDDLLGAISSRTARQILAALHDEPASASELTAKVETSLQNVQYHLGRMSDAGVVEVVETVYSEKGREMKVYAPADRPLVVVAAGSEETTGLRTALTRLLGAVGILGIVSLLVQLMLGSGLGFGARTAGAGAAGGAESTALAADTAATTAASAASGLPPGLLFFLGGLAVIAVAFAVWYVRR